MSFRHDSAVLTALLLSLCCAPAHAVAPWVMMEAGAGAAGSAPAGVATLGLNVAYRPSVRLTLQTGGTWYELPGNINMLPVARATYTSLLGADFQHHVPGHARPFVQVAGGAGVIVTDAYHYFVELGTQAGTTVQVPAGHSFRPAVAITVGQRHNPREGGWPLALSLRYLSLLKPHDNEPSLMLLLGTAF
jgi:hypothetical protein